ncbi:MAG: transcription elongation factor GreAB, partial [Leptospiraceae bacterium]|nr:transcription elongation factor GreAB [Leptospiraceae bacterium]
MSQTTEEVQTRDPLLTRIDTQLNEDKVFKDLTATQLNRIKALDELAAEILKSSHKDEAIGILRENLKENPASLTSRYLLGNLLWNRTHRDDQEGGFSNLRTLLVDFSRSAKWTIVDHIADRILDQDEDNRVALRAKVESTERLKGKKELAPYLEKLAQIDRKNPDIVKKYALSILDEDKDRALVSLKQAAETYARLKDYKNLEEIWQLVVEHDHQDLPFFERIERILAGNREKTRIAAYLVSLVEPYKTEENWPAVINILKKILEYEPNSSRSRSDLVRAYRSQYADHSLLNDFLKMSDLTNHKKPVGPCIASFERNIVFDKGNYVNHRTRGVGKIIEIDNDQVIVDFHENKGQRMSIQMAISSLQPLSQDHIWVRIYENAEEVDEIFKSDIPLFFEMLLSSFGYSMTLAEIKVEIVPRFLSLEEWSKWWSRVRTQLKKEPRFGFDPRKKDLLILRETPMTLSEELSEKFQGVTDWNKKLDLALETLRDSGTEGAAELCIQFYRENERNKDTLKRIQSYLFLDQAADSMGEDIPSRTLSTNQVEDLIRKASQEELITWCRDTNQVELKRELVNLIISVRDDYTDILSEILLEVPIKINRYVLSELNRLGQHDTLKDFLKRIFRKYREHPEAFLWTARSILTGQWDYNWVEHNRQDVLLLVFRVLKPLVKAEKKGTRLKNQAIETVFGTNNITVESLKRNDILREIVESAEVRVLRRMYALFREVPYAADAHKENFYEYLQELRPEFNMDTIYEDDEDE